MKNSLKTPNFSKVLNLSLKFKEFSIKFRSNLSQILSLKTPNFSKALNLQKPNLKSINFSKNFSLKFTTLFALFVLPNFALASVGGGGGEYDIVARTINFLIFFAILFYLLKNPAKNFYNGRIAKISNRLNEIQKKVLESKNKKLEMMKAIESAKKESLEAIEDAKKEAQILADKIKAEAQNDIMLLERYFDEQKDYERRKMQKEVINLALKELFKKDLEQDEMMKILLKKVS